jgi:predicted CXXCH cytochrome family protein
MKFAVLALAVLNAAYGQHEPAPPLGSAPAQPLPFSHRVHTAAQLKCLDCHATAASARPASLPAEAFCMRCHIAIKKDSPAIAQLAASAKEKKAIAWIRLYTLPDYVSFSHKRHHGKAGIACQECHGDVAAEDVLPKLKPIGMTTCQGCHDARKANNNCDACHAPHPN